jgi:hypothetical protein
MHRARPAWMLSGVIIPWRERPERRAELHPFCLRGWHIASLAQENQMLSIDVGRLQTNWTQIQSAGTHKDSNLSFDLQPWGDDPDPRLDGASLFPCYQAIDITA